jgi:tRNA-modifying protein YgfZ
MLQTSTQGYTALRQEAARIDDSARGRIRMTGEDRARLLHAMTTNNIQTLKPGQGCYVLFLNAQGRIQADADVLCFDDRLLIDTEPELRAKIYEHLDRCIIADDVTLEDVTSQLDSVTIEGPQAANVLSGLGAPVPTELFSHAEWGAGTVQRTSSTTFRLFFPTGQMPDLGVPEATADEARTVRIEQGRPRYGEEITARYLAQEAGVMQAVSFTKGCYLGQEIVERVRSRGQVHKHLRALELDTDQPLDPGTKLTIDGVEAGELVSSAYSPALGKTVAMAYMRTQSAETGSTFLAGQASGRVRPPEPA